MHPIYQLLDVMNDRNLLDPVQKQLVVPLPEEELYDVQADPWEINNLVNEGKYKDALKRMRSELTSWQEKTRDHGMLEDSPELEQAFVDYGIQSAQRYDEKARALREVIAAEIDNEFK